MMSERHNNEHLMVLKSLGTQTAAVKKDIARLPVGQGRKWYLKRITGKLGTAGVTGAQAVDVHAGEGAGVTILGSTKISFATTVQDPTYPTLGQLSYDEGTLFQIDNDTVHSGTAAIDLTVALLFSRIPPAAVVNA
jgi:hypothetical protein